MGTTTQTYTASHPNRISLYLCPAVQKISYVYGKGVYLFIYIAHEEINYVYGIVKTVELRDNFQATNESNIYATFR